MVRHAGIGRAEVADVVDRRWPGAVVGDVGSISPTWNLTVEDAADLARAKRGVEPLRIVVLAQRSACTLSSQAEFVPIPAVEPMPVIF